MKVEMILRCIDETVEEQLLERVFLNPDSNNRLTYGAYHAFPIRRLQLAVEFADELDKTWLLNSEFLEEAIKKFVKTKLCKFFFPDLKNKDTLFAKMEYLNDCLVKRAQFMDNLCTSEYRGGTNGIKEFVEVYYELLHAYASLDSVMQAVYYPAWKEALFNPERDKNCKEKRFLVHFFSNPKKSFFSTYPLSCSLISKRCYATYRNYVYGFMYNPESYNIIGMSPEDAGFSGILHDYSNDIVANLLSLIGGDLRLDRYNIQVYGVINDMLSCYPLEEFEKRIREDRHSEILIDGGEVPSAVFIFKDSLKDASRRVLSICYAMNLPLVIFDQVSDEARCIRVDNLVDRVSFNVEGLWREAAQVGR